MKKRTDLTPLIDILFILLFAILIQGNAERADRDADFEAELAAERAAADDAVAALAQSPVRLAQDVALAWDAMSSRVRVIRLELRSKENHLFIDQTATGIYMTESADTYVAYREQLIRALRAVTDREDARLIVFILREDGRVYRYAWLALQAAVREHIEEFGAERAIYAIAPAATDPATTDQPTTEQPTTVQLTTAPPTTEQPNTEQSTTAP